LLLTYNDGKMERRVNPALLQKSHRETHQVLRNNVYQEYVYCISAIRKFLKLELHKRKIYHRFGIKHDLFKLFYELRMCKK
jgi:hypothetical protein